MAAKDIIARLGCWAGYDFVCASEQLRGERRWCVVQLKPRRGIRHRCSCCGGEARAIHDTQLRRVRDLPIFEVPVELVVPRQRVMCPTCGPKLERLDWLAPYARVTTRLASSVARMCKAMSIVHVARYYGLDWDTVKQIDCRHLERELGPIDLAGVEIIAMDEFAIQKGHRYATVVVEPLRKRVLWVGRGRGRDDIKPFFDLLGADGCAQLKAVAMDMSAAYGEELRHRCPNAQIVYDLFHVIAKYGREVIDRVRVDEANRLRNDRPARRLVKSARWLLLKNRENVSREADQLRLDELLAANQALMTVYVMKDDLKQLWRYRHAGYAKSFWQAWYRRAMSSRLEPLKVFARRLRPYVAGILAHCRYPLGTNLIEGINNTIKVIKRMAYGFRDDHYFFLRIRAAFPGHA